MQAVARTGGRNSALDRCEEDLQQTVFDVGYRLFRFDDDNRPRFHSLGIPVHKVGSLVRYSQECELADPRTNGSSSESVVIHVPVLKYFLSSSSRRISVL